MYSKDKKRYVEQTYPNSLESQQVVMHSLLVLKGYESDWDMDFTMTPIEVLQPAFNRVVSTRWIGATATLNRFKQYALWRKAQGLPCGDAVFDLRIDPSDAIRESMLSSPEQLAMLLSAAFDPPLMHTIDIIYRVFLWMGFSGLEDRQAISITADCVNFDRMYIETSTGEYPIYEESLEDFELACELRAFVRGGKLVPRADGNNIMRGKRSNRKVNTDAMLTHTIRPTLTRKLVAAASVNQNRQKPVPVSFDITYRGVYLSGVFYRFHELERLGVPPDFDRYANAVFGHAQTSDKPYRISVRNPKAAVLLRIKKNAATDYANWKHAFNLE